MPAVSIAFLTVLFLCLAGIPTAQAAVYHVGPGQSYPTIASVPTLKPGDVVEIEPGEYQEYRKWKDDGTAEHPITLRGVGASRPVIDGSGLDVTGAGAVPRALWQFEGDHYVIENVEFRNACNGQNGAGVRITGANDTVLRNCMIHNCEMGIMSDNNDRLLIERCEIAFNGNPEHFNGYAHNLYLEGNRTTVRYSWIHDAIAGFNFKSRGHYTELLYNWIADSNEGELSLVDSDKTKPTGSNAVVIGNVIVSKPDRTGNHGKFIDWGQDVGGERNGTLFLLNNTLIAGSPQISFLSSSSPGAKIEATNNVFFGSDRIVNAEKGAITGSYNWLPQTMTPPSGFKGSVLGADPGFAGAKRKDFHLAADSPCRDAGLSDVTYRDGDDTPQNGLPRYQMDSPLHVSPRRDSGRPDLGAFAVTPSSKRKPPFSKKPAKDGSSQQKLAHCS
jgi:hypothetical protein